MSATRVARFVFPALRRAVTAPAVDLIAPREPSYAYAFSCAAAAAASRRHFLLRHMTTEASAEEAVDGLPKSVPVAVAHELLKSGHRYLDVRTVEEFCAGHAVGAVNIQYMLSSGLGRTKNTSFLQEVSSTFEKDDKIVVGCLSGKRSLMAASELTNAGFTAVKDVGGGYSAWVQNGLPTEK